MTKRPPLLIQPLGVQHDRQAFVCGIVALDAYLHKQAGQDVKRRVSRVFVATEDAAACRIAGYYTLSSLSIDLGQLPDALARKLPRHPIPAALLGRLAVAQTAQGRGIGKMLLADALKRTLMVSEQIGIHALVVDAIDERAQTFYQRFGFAPMASASRRRLYLPLKSI